MKKIILGLLLLTLTVCLWPDSRKALVIGNSAYLSGPLRNPVNDARAMATTLRELGFEVTTGYDVEDCREMLRLVQNFGAALESIPYGEERVGLFYYAGHGVQYDGKNYLMPTQANLLRESDIEVEGLPMDRVLREMSHARNDFNIIILDACRNNPFATSYRAFKRGLAAINPNSIPGTLIAYATSEDGMAQDGTGDNGVYTEELLKNIKIPGLSLNQVLMKTAEQVIAKTNGAQTPWQNHSMTRDFFFAAAPKEAPITVQPKETQVQTLHNYGSIVVSSIREADLYLDGVFKDKVSPAASKVISDVAVGNHTLEARASDGKESKNIYVSKGQEAEVFFSWVPDSMVYVEGGTFTMGINNGEFDEKPAHEVTVSSFFIGKYEVTQAEFAKYMQEDLRWKKKRGLGNNYPAYDVTWYNILQYCNLRSLAEGLTPCYSIAGSTDPNDWGPLPLTTKDAVWDAVVCNWGANGYRLPTEAEWEFAARGGVKSQGYLYSGSKEYDSVAWHDRNARKKSHTVGTKAANELGIYDMSGNLWEWCWDWYGAYSENPQHNPTGPKNGNGRVLRGGSWRFNGPSSRVSYRASLSPRGSNYDFGFRLCRTVK